MKTCCLVCGLEFDYQLPDQRGEPNQLGHLGLCPTDTQLAQEGFVAVIEANGQYIHVRRHALLEIVGMLPDGPIVMGSPGTVLAIQAKVSAAK